MMRVTLRRLSPLLLLAIALGLLLLSDPFEAYAASPDFDAPGKVSFGLSGTGDASISVPLPETVEWQQFQPGARLEARVTDPNAATRGNVVHPDDVTWKWYRGNTLVSGPTAGRDGRNYTVVTADVGRRIKVEATYNDGNGPDKTVSYTSPNPVQRYRDPKANRLPVFPSSFATVVTVTVAENSRGNIGHPVTATDPDGDILTYTVRGIDASVRFFVPRFTIDNATGQLKLALDGKLDYEDRSSYEVQVRAYDSSANNTGAEIDPQVTVDTTVRIHVTNVDEKPTFGAGVPAGEILAQTEGRTAIDLDNDRTTTPNDLATFVASDPEGSAVTLSLRGPDAGVFELAADTDSTNAVSQVLSFKETTDFDMPGDSNRNNAYEVTVRASDGAKNADRTLIIKVIRPSTVDAWTPTLTPKDLGDGRLGCHNGVSGAECGSALRFTDTRIVFGQIYNYDYTVQELYLTPAGELVLTMDPSIPPGFTLSTMRLASVNGGQTPGDLSGDPVSGSVAKFSLDRARLNQAWTQARWRSSGLKWIEGWDVRLGMERPRATLSSITVHYDSDPPVNGFGRQQPASPSSFGHRANIPGMFSYLDRDNWVRYARTTHAKIKVFPAYQGTTIKVGKVTYDYDPSDGSGSRARSVALMPVAFGKLSHTIELSTHSPHTGVDIEVTDGSVVSTYFLNIDPPTPPPRTYSLTPQAHVVEGEDALLTLALSRNAPTAGAEFTVTLGHPPGGADAGDVDSVTSTVTVPGGSDSAEIRIPTVDDDVHEPEESFTVTVAVVGPGWAVAPLGTDTAAVTIADNDEAPPDGTEPWDIQVTSSDGTLTVTWRVNPRDGVEDSDIRHALRWSQEPGVWANPVDPRGIGRNDGITVEGGVTSYVITGLTNDVATGVFVRSFTGDNRLENAEESSDWVRTKGEHTTPKAGQQQQQQAAPGGTWSVTAAATAAEGGGAVLTLTLNEAAPEGGVGFSVAAGYSGDATATADDVGAIASPVTVGQGNTTLAITIPTADDAVDEDDETFTVSITANTAGWAKADDGQDTATVTITDDDTAGVTVSPASLGISEDGTGAYTVVLDSEPTADVTVTPGSGDGGAASVSPSSHTFTASNWNEPATFTVSGVADDDSNDESVGVSHWITSDDWKYALAPLPSVSVAVSDTTTPQEQGSSGKYADLIARIKEWRNDPAWVDDKAHTDRWDRVLLALGEEVADQTLTPMTAAEAQELADKGWQRWVRVAEALTEIEGGGQQQQQQTPNSAPTVSASIADATIVNESGTRQVSLSGVFSDADNDALTITAASSDTAKATVSVAADQTTLTVTAKARGTATITVTADDGNGGTVEDTFNITVKAAPVVASAIADATMTVESSLDVSLSGVFNDADGDALSVTAASSDDSVATAILFQGTLTLLSVKEGSVTITVTAQDSDGNTVSDAFDVTVEKKYAALIKRMYQWRNDPEWADDKEHTDRWDRALLALGETVEDKTLTAMTAAEAQEFADRGWERWVEVAKALKEIEGN